MQHRFYRSATHPDFIKFEIEPKLVEHELSTALAIHVARFIDNFDYSIESAIAVIKTGLKEYEQK